MMVGACSALKVRKQRSQGRSECPIIIKHLGVVATESLIVLAALGDHEQPLSLIAPPLKPIVVEPIYSPLIDPFKCYVPIKPLS